jgi:hypothetical protein
LIWSGTESVGRLGHVSATIEADRLAGDVAVRHQLQHKRRGFVGGSESADGGIVTPIFFVGATSGAALAPFFGMPTTLLAAVGLVAMLAAAANTPIAASVMAMELLPGPVGVYAALAAATAFLMVGHRSVYASQKIGLSKSAGLDVELGGAIGDVSRASVRIRKGSLTERVHQFGRVSSADRKPEPGGSTPPTVGS